MDPHTYPVSDVAMIVGVVIGGLTSLAVAVGNIVVAVRNGRKVDENTALTAAGIARTEVVVGHVNSESTRAQGQIAALQKENDILREVLADKRKTAEMLAQAAAGRGGQTDRPERRGIVPGGGDTPVSLHEPIEVKVVNEPLTVVSTDKEVA